MKVLLQPLVERLGSEEYAAREEAYVALERLGLAALPALREALGHPDPEIRTRARGLIDEIAYDLAARAASAEEEIRRAEEEIRRAIEPEPLSHEKETHREYMDFIAHERSLGRGDR